MRKCILFLFCFFAVALGFAQNISYRSGNCKSKSDFCPKFSLFHETIYNFGGLGVNSINADIKLSCNRQTMTSLRVGINYLSFPRISSVGIPIEFNYMIGRGAWMFECGGGLDYLWVYKNYSPDNLPVENKVSWLAVMARVGVRYDKQNGLFFRAGYNPHVSLLDIKKIPPISQSRFLHFASVGIGYTF